MSKATPLVLSGGAHSVQTVRKTGGRKPFEKVERLELKPSQSEGLAGLRDSVLHVGLWLLTGLAMACALFIAVYSIAPSFHWPLPSLVPALGEDLRENILVGGLFFGLEVILIVLGGRLLNEVLTKSLARRQLRSIEKTLRQALDEAETMIDNFVDELNKTYEPSGRFATDLSFMNVGLIAMRKRFMERMFCDLDLTGPALLIMQRTLRTLDMFCEDSYAVTERVFSLDRAKKYDELLEELIALINTVKRVELHTLVSLVQDVRRKV